MLEWALGAKTDILLISSNRAADVRQSLPLALAQADARVTVIDNGCTDQTSELARQAGAGVLRLDVQRSWCEANNAAIAITGCDEVLLLNADCFLEPDALAYMRTRLWEPGIGSVAPKLLRAQAGGEPLPEIDTAGMLLDRRRKNNLIGHGSPAAHYDRPGTCFGADGAAALYRREVLEQCVIDAGPLDETFEKYAADVDLAWRAQLYGWQCAYEPRGVANHIRTYSPSTRPQVPLEDRRLQFRNRYLMMIKNDTAGGLLRDLPWIAGYELLALGHVLLRERELLGAYRDAWRLAPVARRHRRQVQAGRKVDVPPFGCRPPER